MSYVTPVWHIYRIYYQSDREENNTNQAQIVSGLTPQVVNNELGNEVDSNNEDEEQRSCPSHKVHSEKDASEQAINDSFGGHCPIPVAEMPDG